MDEVPLAGGSVASSVVRVGDTVRRATERSSPAVHALLVHLEAVVLAGSPRFLGLDHQGREILTWIDGTPATKPWPAPLLTENGVRRLARLLRGYHEAVATFSPPADSEWWTGMRGLEPGEVALHGDLGVEGDLAGRGARRLHRLGLRRARLAAHRRRRARLLRNTYARRRPLPRVRPSGVPPGGRGVAVPPNATPRWFKHRGGGAAARRSR